MRTAAIYNFLLEAAITASIAILLMIPIRKYLRKPLGNKALCFAWLLVALRLLCPLSLPNPVIHEITTPYNFDQAHVRPIAGQVMVRVRDAVNQAQSRAYMTVGDRAWAENKTPDEIMGMLSQDANVRFYDRLYASLYNGKMAHALMYVYAAGVMAVLCWFTVSNARFRRELKKNRIEALSGELWETYEGICREMKAKPLPVYVTDPLPGACLVGLIRPWIALPASADKEQAALMLRHEMRHYKALDPLWTAVQMLCCAVHWFNPLVWAAADMCRTDREMRCDDAVTAGMDEEHKRLYAGALVQSAGRKNVPTLPVLATGMSVTGRKLKQRVAGIVNGGKRLAVFSVVFAVTASLLLVCAFATSDVPYDERVDWNLTATSGFNHHYDRYKGVPLAEQKLNTPEKALAFAKELWQGKYLAQDISGAAWYVPLHDIADGVAYFGIEGSLPDGTRLHMNLLPDGAVDYLFVTAAENETEKREAAAQPTPLPLPMEENEKPSAEETQSAASMPTAASYFGNASAARPDAAFTLPTREELLLFVQEAAEALDPGVLEKATGIQCSYDPDLCAAGDQETLIINVFGEDERYVTVELIPGLRLLQYGVGNG